MISKVSRLKSLHLCIAAYYVYKDGEKCDTTADDYGPSSGLTYKTRESCYNRCKGMGAALMYKHWRVDATCNADGCYCLH